VNKHAPRASPFYTSPAPPPQAFALYPFRDRARRRLVLRVDEHPVFAPTAAFFAATLCMIRIDTLLFS